MVFYYCFYYYYYYYYYYFLIISLLLCVPFVVNAECRDRMDAILEKLPVELNKVL